MIKIPLFGNGVFGKSATVTAQRRVNCYYSIHADSDKTQICVFGTPGLTLFAICGVGPVRGVHQMSSKNLLYVVSRNSLFELDTVGNVNFRGNVTPGVSVIDMADNGTQLLILDGVKGWIYNANTLSLAPITDGNFPQNATSCCFDGGYFLVNDPTSVGRFRKSMAYNGATWQATDFGTAESNPDPLVALMELNQLILLFGSLTVEFHQNVGSLGFPYAPIQGSAQSLGLAAKRSLAKVGSSAMFLGSLDGGPVQIIRLEGFYPRIVSTEDINSVINTFSVTSDAVAFGYTLDGQEMYQITFPTAQRSFLYAVNSNMWSELQSGTGLTGVHSALVGTGFNGSTYVGDYQSGSVYELDPYSYTDNGSPILRLIQTRHVYHEHNIIGVDELYFDMETGVGPLTGQGSTPQIMLQTSKDNGRTFGPERLAGFAPAGHYSSLGPRAIWRRFGASRDFVWRIKVTDPVKFSLTGGAVSLRAEESQSQPPRGRA